MQERDGGGGDDATAEIAPQENIEQKRRTGDTDSFFLSFRSFASLLRLHSFASVLRARTHSLPLSLSRSPTIDSGRQAANM